MSSEKIHDPVFSQLTWDEYDRSWLGKVLLTPKHPIEVLLCDCGNPPDDECLTTCRATFDRIRKKELAFRLATAEGVVQMHNDCWQKVKDDETPASFAAKMRLTSIRMYSEGAAEIIYEEDNRLLGGRFILAEFNADEAIVNMDIS